MLYWVLKKNDPIMDIAGPIGRSSDKNAISYFFLLMNCLRSSEIVKLAVGFFGPGKNLSILGIAEFVQRIIKTRKGGDGTKRLGIYSDKIKVNRDLNRYTGISITHELMRILTGNLYVPEWEPMAADFP